MIEIAVRDREGKELRKEQLDEKALGGKARVKLMHDAVVMYHDNARVGTASTRTKGEVAGSGRKPWRQKGTGRARCGSRRSPLWRGGGTMFGPKPRDYSWAMPKKARRAALRSALLSKLADGEVVVVDQIALEKPRTREIARMLDALDLFETVVLVLADYDKNVYLSARNIPGVRVTTARDLNALDVLRPKRLLVTKPALDAIVKGGPDGARQSSAAVAEVKP